MRNIPGFLRIVYVLYMAASSTAHSNFYAITPWLEGEAIGSGLRRHWWINIVAT